MQKVFVNELKPNRDVQSVFLVLSKTKPQGKTGKPYLNIKLSDKTGEVDAKVWDNVEEMSQKFNESEFVELKGKTLLYQDKIQINISEINRVEDYGVAIEDYLPATTHDIQKMYNELLSLIKTEVVDEDIQKLLLAILTDAPVANKFKRSPAAKTMHHAFIGGLLEHELGLMKLAIDVCKHYPHINRNYVLAGCLLHDLGKIYELSCEKNFEYTDEGQLLGHLIIGIEMITKYAATFSYFPDEKILLLKHLIASHHGRLDYGSPKVPMTLEAIMVHYLDDMDSKLQAMKEHMDKEKGNPSKWTTYHRLFERVMYKG